MTAKSVLLRPGERAPTYPPCYATAKSEGYTVLSAGLGGASTHFVVI